MIEAHTGMFKVLTDASMTAKQLTANYLIRFFSIYNEFFDNPTILGPSS